jgi:hypothetical protein
MSLLQNPETDVTERNADQRGRKPAAIPILLALGFFLRLFHAQYRFLNADEALHYLLSVAPSLAGAYHASLTTVHPPLLILFLHYWGMIGQSELFLRLPSMLAGIGFCWLMYRWLRMVTDDDVALLGLVLLLFSPALVFLSAEIRQYALLLLFSSASLFFFESALQRRSALRMVVSAVSLYLALLTHYSSLIFALTLGVYALLRLVTARMSARVIAVWVAGQIGALGIVSVLYVTHISKLEARGAGEWIAESYLRRSIFQLGDDHVFSFVARSNLRLFHYFFCQGAVGVVALILFAVGVAFLLRQRRSADAEVTPAPWLLPILLLFPLAVNCALAVLRIYPYGGTRHNSYLAIFIFPAISTALARWRKPWKLQKFIVIAIVLAICNLFPAPIDQYIRLRDQKRARMAAAVEVLKKIPAGSAILTDDQGALLLSYYLCHHQVAQVEQAQPFLESSCGDLSVVALDPRKWIFKPDTFAQELSDAQQEYNWTEATSPWLFQAGWFIDKEPELREELRAYGCTPGTQYGHNILLCRLTVPRADSRPN